MRMCENFNALLKKSFLLSLAQTPTGNQKSFGSVSSAIVKFNKSSVRAANYEQAKEMGISKIQEKTLFPGY